MSLNSLGEFCGLFEVHWCCIPLLQMKKYINTAAKVRLCPHQDDGRRDVTTANLRNPFCSNVVEGHWVDQAEAEDEDIHVGIAQGAKLQCHLLPMEN
uniref:Uncharacterized protein n=1 Tax=Knipowitschia caucasica TaxID=637954 RepID=A0AAV2JFW2_KNICA